MNVIYYLSQPWPWYVSGPAITAIMLALIFQGRTFGVSSNLRTLCSIGGAGKHLPFFNFDYKAEYWNLLFLAGAIAGGSISAYWLSGAYPLQISQATISDLRDLHINFDGQLLPARLYGVEALSSVKTWLLLTGGGFLVGLGSRYAGGCTSGHAISGLSDLQLPSLFAVIGFFAGGLIMTHLIYPIIF